MLHFIWRVLRVNAGRATLVLSLQFLVVFAEGLSVAALLPLLLFFTGGVTDSSGAIRTISNVFAAVGLPMSLPSMLTFMVVIITVKAVFTFFAWRQMGAASAAVAAGLRHRLLAAVARARWSYFVDQSIGELTVGVGAHTIRAAGTLKKICEVFAEGAQVGIYMVLALWIAPWYVTIGAIAVAGFLFLTLGRLTAMRRDTEQRESSALSQLAIQITDSLRSFKGLKAMGVQDHFVDLLHRETGKINAAQRLSALLLAAGRSATEPTVAIPLAVGLYVAIVHLNVPGPELLFTALLFARMAGRAASLQRDYDGLVGAKVQYEAMENIIEAAEAQAEPARSGELIEMERAIVLERLCFGYGSRLVLDHVDAVFERGKLTAIQGPSGVGKTTLIDILIGLHRPTSGRILVDGKSLDEIDSRYWRERIGYVPQDSMLLHESIAANIALGRPSISDADIEAALKRAEAWPFVTALPEGIQSSTGEYGARLSGGQRQRLAIARALVHRPHLLILDEPTSALDTEIAAELVRTLQRLAHEERVCVLAVTHHQLLSEAADVLYEIQDGRLRAVSAPTPMMAKKQQALS